MGQEALYLALEKLLRRKMKSPTYIPDQPSQGLSENMKNGATRGGCMTDGFGLRRPIFQRAFLAQKCCLDRSTRRAQSAARRGVRPHPNELVVAAGGQDAAAGRAPPDAVNVPGVRVLSLPRKKGGIWVYIQEQ